MPADEKSFEDDVRRIARIRWPAAALGGAQMEYGQERDGIFITDEMVHLVECTVSRRKDKALQDAGKLAKLAQQMRSRYPTKGVKGWFITLEEPTAEQRTVVNKASDSLVALSFHQFKSSIIDARAYIDSRARYSFGSMQDPETGGRLGNFEYVRLDMVDNSGRNWDIQEIATDLLGGKSFVFLGDYGAGKSTTMRELFQHLTRTYRANRSSRFPILLNLRDHHGQTNPAEALERHARNVGYKFPSQLVQAWLAGYAVLLLDGFDEVAAAGWTGQAKRLRDIRRRSMELLRRFVRESPTETGIAISGRSNFFDNNRELEGALGLGSEVIQISLNDFTDEQVQEYLRRKGWTNAIPSWLPSRPLLLGYLASKNLLEQVLRVDAGSGPAAGWDTLLARISEREAEIEAGIDGETVRLLIERMATIARRSNDGLGILQQDDIVHAFYEVCGYSPDDRGVVLLQRLPGLGATEQEDGTRKFIDRDFVDAARAGDVVRFIDNPFSFDLKGSSEWQSTLGQLGREVAAYACHNKKYNPAKIATAAQYVSQAKDYSVLCADIIQVTQEMGYGYKGEPIYIKDTLLSEASFGDEGEDFSGINYQNCLFQRLEMAAEANADQLPHFFGCYFGLIEGRVSKSDLPPGVFDDHCTFDGFGDSAATTAGIMSLSLPLGVRVLLTILKKLYLQPGSGRKESALFRGLDYRARPLVHDVLQLLRREQLAVRSTVGEDVVWLPARSEGMRIRRLVSAPMTSGDPLLARVEHL